MKTRNERILKLVNNWVRQVGVTEAMRRLVMSGVGLSTADKIVNNRYESTPGNMLSKILEVEMGRDNIILSDAI